MPKSTALSSGPSEESRLVVIRKEDVDLVWPVAKSFVKAALDKVPGDYTVDYIHHQLKAGKSQMTVAFKRHKLAMVLTTEVHKVITSDSRVCVITSFSAELEDYEKYLPVLHKYAAMEDCKLIRLYGRPGWIKRLREHGYEQPWVALEKKVT